MEKKILKLVSYFTVERMIVTIFIVGFLVFFNAFFNGFVMDDQSLVVRNQNVHSFQLIHFFQGSIFDIGGSLGGVYYRPLQSILFAGIYAIAGEHAFLYHFVQVLLHCINTVLVLLIFRKYIEKSIAFLLSLIFLIHPMQVEAVSYIASMQDVLFVFFGLLYILSLRKFYETKYWLFLPYVFLLASFLSKESGILFLLLGTALVFIFEKKDRFVHIFLSGCTFGVYLFLRVGVAGMLVHTTNEFIMMRLPLSQRLINIPLIMLFYLKTFFLPIDLVAVQSWVVTNLSFSYFFLPLLVIMIFFGGLGYMCYALWRKTHIYNSIVFFTAWFLIGMSLHIQLTPLDVTVADRYFYFPMIGLLGVCGVLLSHIAKQTFFRHSLIYFSFVIILLLFLGGRTIFRNANWIDTKVLALHDLQIQPDNYQLLSSLGAMYLEEKNYPKAVYYAQKSVNLYPYWGMSAYNLGVGYHLNNNIPQARKYYTLAMHDAPLNVEVYENMAILLLHNDSLKNTRSFTRDSLKKFPTSVKMWQVLAATDHKLGLDSEASQAAQMYFFLTSPK